MSISIAPELGEAVRDAAQAIDATMALLARPGDRRCTCDPDDSRKLCGRRGTMPP
jgi:hypothetical protein